MEKKEQNSSLEKEEESEESPDLKEEPTPLPVLHHEELAHVEKDEEKSKYQKELEDSKKKRSTFTARKKSMEIKATTKISRNDFLSKLEKADLKDQNNPHNQKYMPFDGFKGPAAKRKNTNCLCLLIFVLLNGALFINAMLVFVNGSSNRLMNGTDFRAEICGVDERVNRPYLYYLEPTVDTNVAMCVSICPNSTLPVQRALKDSILFHLGTVLLIVLMAPFSAIPKALFGNLKKVLKKSNQKSSLVKFLISSLMCCFYLYDKYFRFHSYQTYVQVAMWSLPHHKACQKAYFLINRHKKELRNIDFMQRFVLFQTKVCCSLISCIFVYIFISFSEKSIIGKDLKSVETPFVPAIFVLLIAFFFSTIFQGSFDIIGKTILQCYLMDIEMFVGDQRYIEAFLREFLQFFGLKAEQKKIEVEAERPNYIIGVTVQPLPPEKEAVKPELDIEDFSESSDDSEDSKESEQSIELMPVTISKPKQVSRPETAQSGVEGFQNKKIEGGKDVFLDDINKGKKVGIDFDPFSYAPVKSSNNPSRPATKDLVNLRPPTNNNNIGIQSRSVTNDAINMSKNQFRPVTNDKLTQNNSFMQVSNTRPNSNDVNKINIPQKPGSKDINFLRPHSQDINKPVSRPLSKDINQQNTSFNFNQSLNSLPPKIKENVAIPKNKVLNESTGMKLELIQSRPISKDVQINKSNLENIWGVTSKQDNSRPVSKDLFMKNKEDHDLSVSINLFNKSRMNDETFRFENLSVAENDQKKNDNGNKPNLRLN